MRIRPLLPLVSAVLVATACSQGAERATPAGEPAAAVDVSQQGQAAVQDSESTPDIVKVATGSKDHTTLVAALKAADLVNSLANAGPFTVFAPTNAAFEKLPQGTVESLLKPENKEKLVGILQHHVTTSALDLESLTDGQELGMVAGGRVKFTKRGADSYIGDAKIVGTVRASNGMVYVIDGVLLP